MHVQCTPRSHTYIHIPVQACTHSHEGPQPHPAVCRCFLAAPPASHPGGGLTRGLRVAGLDSPARTHTGIGTQVPHGEASEGPFFTLSPNIYRGVPVQHFHLVSNFPMELFKCSRTHRKCCHSRTHRARCVTSSLRPTWTEEPQPCPSLGLRPHV